jgi:hypothetical protein
MGGRKPTDERIPLSTARAGKKIAIKSPQQADFSVKSSISNYFPLTVIARMD